MNRVFKIKIIQPRFDEIYDKYEKMNKEDKKLQGMGILNKGKNNTYIGNAFQNLAVGIQDEGEGTMAQDNVFLSSSKNADLYAEILKWASNKIRFSEQELFNKFTQLSNSNLKDWYFNVFRGAVDNNECLIGVYDDKKGSFYCSLTAKGKSAYSSLKSKSKINIEKMEIISGDKVGRDKIEQHDKKNKASIKNDRGESFLSKFFWQVIVAFTVGLIIIYVAFRLGLNK